MSKKATASPSASAAGVGTNTTGAPGEGQTTGEGGAQLGATGEGDTANAGTVTGETKVVKEIPAAALDWAAGLQYPKSTFLRNNGHVSVVEPITAQIVGGGAAVPVVLHDEAHAVAVLGNVLSLNALHFQGDLKVRLDAAPDELYVEG